MGIGTLMLAYATTDVPAPNDFAKAQTGGDYTKLMLYPQAGIHALVGTTISL